MGFHVSLDGNSEALTKLLTTDPSSLFGEQYGAYILFLAGAPDREQLDWIIDNAVALDSLTGEHVAFAVFAERFQVRLKTHQRGKRPPRTVGTIPLHELQERSNDITRIVKSGKFGIVFDDDEITALTYGTDEIARDLGVFGRIPCAVILDAIPAAENCIVKIDSDLTGRLIPILRATISEFEVSGGAKFVSRHLNRVREIQRGIEAARAREAVLKGDIDRAIRSIAKLEQRLAGKLRNEREREHLTSIAKARKLDLIAYESELGEVPRTTVLQLASLEKSLESALREYKRSENLTFSHIFQRQLHREGLHAKLAKAKASGFSYLANMIKPEVLIKILDVMSRI